MSDYLVFLIMGIIVFGGIVAIAAYYLMRYLRGSIKLYLDENAFMAGGNIKGNIELITRKEIQGNRLVVNLIGDKVTKVYKDDKTEVHSHEFYRSGNVLENSKVFPAGFAKKYEFEIPIPSNDDESSAAHSSLKNLLSAASQLIGNNRDTFYEWKVESRLDAVGIDLADSKNISINL